MAAALARSARCQTCRNSILQTFAALSGLAISQTARFPIKPQIRGFSAPPCWRTESSDRSINAAATDMNQEGQQVKDTHKASQAVPWYLRVETHAEEPHPVARRQEIPPVPENSPPIIKDLLQNISVEIGLDDLALLDLRARDPPSALGGNVIMIIGTARSLKHLNVSADRFCRWLRSAYKMRPNADGLLGRNELKIKLRRKARRARISGGSGASVASSDDGITTGWICVNVGFVDDPGAINKVKEGVFEGFGKTQSGTRVVVQMFTEEKRADVDLEQLWAPKRESQIKKIETRLEGLNENSQAFQSDSNLLGHENSSRQGSNPFVPSPTRSFGQRREFSTDSKRQKTVWPDFIINLDKDDSEAVNGNKNLGLLHSYRREIYSCPTIEMARGLLGDGPDDRISTDFLQRCHTLVEGEHRLQSTLQLMLAAAGINTRHPTYSKEYLWTVFMEHTASGFELDESLAFDIANSFLSPRLPRGEQVPAALREFDVESAFRVLDFLSLRGTLTLEYRMFILLYRALLTAPSNEDADVILQKSRRIRQVMDTLHGVVDWNMPESQKIMQLRLQVKDTEGFWEMWHAIPFTKGTRTSEDYEVLFRTHAIVGDPTLARHCVVTWLPMMQREEPPIVLNSDLISDIATCIYTAGYDNLDFNPELSTGWWDDIRPSILKQLEAIWKETPRA
ncbi:hypothetical protein BGW36DRAFT_190930 [Talaromyces proteolyticus]|uniref:ATPase synthesis protein 25 n=1 Tax=Talaromyces proteolyticus TaxID=1131652 RepID=A0AAD4KNJ6_9EURO|nr:uncharacterized protein BGW36DRAFT_190930 [Talaromyces proteolyticus]KAH8696703.1 hypothetical protein BGW36DRAFT_190930 [Talaromyces proteolyticus]